MDRIDLAVLGGSGLYSMEGLNVLEEREVDTPFGSPSAPIVIGELAGRRVAFLARHGSGHQLAPDNVNYRANIFALKLLGVERVLSVSACGSLREDYEPGHIVVPDQLFDFTRGRISSFFGEGLVAHLSTADPFCLELSDELVEGLTAAGGTVHRGGRFITIQGPRFSTRAESNTFRAWGMTIIGMTTSPEAFLAREAEMCYAVMGHVTDYDVWHLSEEPVTVQVVIRTLRSNVELAQKAVSAVVESLPEERHCTCGNALEDSIITAREAISPDQLEKLGPLVRRYLS